MSGRPLLYVAAPWRRRTMADAEATHGAISHALRLGWAPIFGPWLYREHLNDANEDERAVAISCDLSLLGACNALMVVGDRVTEGMATELEEWRRLNDTVNEDGRSYRAAKWHVREPYTVASLPHRDPPCDVGLCRTVHSGVNVARGRDHRDGKFACDFCLMNRKDLKQ